MKQPAPLSPLKKRWKHTSLSIILAALFLATWLGGQFATGRADHNNDRKEHGLPSLGVADYFRSAHFLEATAENWESEFFQMYVFVMITVSFYQKGSAESKDPDAPSEIKPALTKRSPWAARKGGMWRTIYSHSLSLGLLLLFLVSFVLHAVGGHDLFNEEQAMEGKPPVSLGEFLWSARFWFQSFQNWQSEFLAILSMVILTVFLREKGSPESKPVNMPHSEHE